MADAADGESGGAQDDPAPNGRVEDPAEVRDGESGGAQDDPAPLDESDQTRSGPAAPEEDDSQDIDGEAEGSAAAATQDGGGSTAPPVEAVRPSEFQVFYPDVHIDIDYESEEARASVSGSLAPHHRQVYIVEASAGQEFRAEIEAPPGVWLDIRKGDQVMLSDIERPRLVEGPLPADGAWRVSVVSTSSETAHYTLAVEVMPPRPVVYLTFDDGPHPTHTPEVLDLLGRYDARATFFVLGRLAERYPELVQRIDDEGHTLANHTWNHENLDGMSRSAFDDTISRTQEVLGDRAAPCLRPPYGALDRNTRGWAAGHGLDVIMWDVSGSDWLDITATEIAGRVLNRVADGSIVLLHDGGGNRSRTVRALEMILEGLSERRMRSEPVCLPTSEVP